MYHAQDARRLVESIRGEQRIRHVRDQSPPLPSREVTIDILHRLRWLLFPGFAGPDSLTDANLNGLVKDALDDLARRLHVQVAAALRYQPPPDSGAQQPEYHQKSREIVIAFVKALPNIRRLLSLDVQAAFDDDPAAHHTDEIIMCYPGVFALSVHRPAHELFRLGVPLLPRMMSEYAHSATGIDIHPGASIGQSCFIDHGTGVVIGETARIGDHCTLYQGVTLGAKSFEKDQNGQLVRGAKRHPTLEDHVTLYAHATILGGDTTIGSGCVVNGGVIVTQSVPPGHVVRGPKIEIKLRANPETPPANWAI
jgi:serine O-acetyltransferase